MENPLRDIQVIIWDVDGTLYDAPDLAGEVYESAYKAIMNKTGWPRERAVTEFDAVHNKITLSATEAVGIICGITTAQAAVLTDTYLDRLRFIKRDEKLMTLFEQLRGFSHYILGNGSKALITEGLIALGLSPDIFREIVTSEISGANKPNENGYRYIMDKTVLPPGVHLMVGDRDRVDLETAKKLGMKTCLVWSAKPSTIADITLPTVYELSQVLV